jgi:hypothetical protein
MKHDVVDLKQGFQNGLAAAREETVVPALPGLQPPPAIAICTTKDWEFPGRHEGPGFPGALLFF